MVKILLDTNLLIYREDHSVVNDKVLELTKILYDSNLYKIVIHPMTLEDISHIKDLDERKIFYSKIKIYETIERPPKAPDDFNNLVGCSKIPNDLIDNNLLYAVFKDCVNYLITNDNKLKNKAKKANISDRVLGIEDVIKLFKPLEEKEIRTPAFINYEYLYNIDIDDDFFDSLKADYKDFESWYKKKSRIGNMAYITRYTNNKISSFLMLKVEYGAFLDNKMIAWIFLSVSNRMKQIKSYIPDIEGKCVDIDGVIVLPEYRGNHLQNILVEHLEKRAKELGINNIVAEVTFGNVYS